MPEVDFGGKGADTRNFAEKYSLVKASSSDAHILTGLGTAFVEYDSEVLEITSKNINEIIKSGNLVADYAPLISYLAPSFNRLKKSMQIKQAR